MSEELTAKEVLEIIYRMCEERSEVCDFGLFKAKSNTYNDDKVSAEEALEICKKWKVNHAPIEAEWVHVCRIIEDKGDYKRCVYEEEIDEDEILPFDTYDRIAEEILKRYMRKHEGNFFAVVERLCRRVVR